MDEPDFSFADYEQYDEENRRKPYRCSDGFCGADDCARCRPNTYWMEDEDE